MSGNSRRESSPQPDPLLDAAAGAMTSDPEGAAAHETRGPGFKWQRSGKAGTGTIIVHLPDGPFTDTCNILSERARKELLLKISERLSLDALEVLSDELELLAASEAAGQRKGSDEASDKEANRLLDLVLHSDDVELFHAPGDAETGYATVRIDDRLETYRLSSSGFKVWLHRCFYRQFGGAPSAQAVSDATQVLTAKALFDGPEHCVETRVAFHGGDVFIDIADAKRQLVHVTKRGWKLISSVDSPVRFVRRQGVLPLPVPRKRGDITLLRHFANLRDEESWVLLVGWMLHALYPKGPYAVLIISGEQGASKSTLARVVQRLVDPNKGGLRRPPKSEQDMMIGASNTWLFTVDNLSQLRNDLSDTLCTVATGGGFAARSLFTNDEESIIEVQRPVLLNGIDEMSRRADLLDRAVVLHLPHIAEEQRRKESEFWKNFETAAPRIFGALLDALVQVLKRRDKVHLSASPRMADFATTVCAAEAAFGWPAGTFLRAYEANRKVANAISLEESQAAQRIVRLMTNTHSWRGTMANLRDILVGIACDSGVAKRAWNPTLEGLGKEIRRVAPVLRKLGIEVDTSMRSTDRARTRIVTIKTERYPIPPQDPASVADTSDGAGDVKCPTESALAGSRGPVSDSSDSSDSSDRFSPTQGLEHQEAGGRSASEGFDGAPGSSAETCPNRPNCPQSPVRQPSKRCCACGGTHWWRLRDTGHGDPGNWVCQGCYPPEPAEHLIERREVGGGHE